MLLSKHITYFRHLKETERNVSSRKCHIQRSHIYTLSVCLKKKQIPCGSRHRFWNTLATFWPESQIAKWKDEVFPNGDNEDGCETAANLIALEYSAQMLWNRGAFALKPISLSTDKKTLILEFHWQKPMKSGQSISLTTAPWPTQGLNEGSGGVFFLTRDISHRPIQIESGHRITMETDDPKLRPLPSFELLRLQWFLQRIMGMAGAADDIFPDPTGRRRGNQR